ncbi:MAG: hypothetical protein GQ531_07530 [Sulfurovum sp.]|nr:hypothetical protein [Sulfurovum sp.]
MKKLIYIWGMGYGINSFLMMDVKMRLNGKYDVRADSTKEFCAVVWDIYDGITNIGNDMTKVCDQ